MNRFLLILDLLGIESLGNQKNIVSGESLRNPFHATNCVIDISGFAFSDQRGTRAARRRWIHFRKARHANNRLFLLPQSWGPFNDFWVRTYARWTLKYACLVYAREKKSYRYLKRAKIAPTSIIRQSVDIAFLFDTSQSGANPFKILNKTRLTKSAQPFISITPNMRIYEKVAENNACNRYETLLVELTRYLLKSTDYNVVLIPHESPTLNAHNDSYLCSSIASRVNCHGRVTVLSDSLSAAEVKEIIGESDFLIASRYHSLVAGLSKRVPVVALGWSHKYDELMEMVGLSEFGVDVLKNNMHNAYNVVLNGLEQKALISDSIQANMPNLEKNITDVFDELVAVICDMSKTQ